MDYIIRRGALSLSVFRGSEQKWVQNIYITQCLQYGTSGSELMYVSYLFIALYVGKCQSVLGRFLKIAVRGNMNNQSAIHILQEQVRKLAILCDCPLNRIPRTSSHVKLTCL